MPWAIPCFFNVFRNIMDKSLTMFRELEENMDFYPERNFNFLLEVCCSNSIAVDQS